MGIIQTTNNQRSFSNSGKNARTGNLVEIHQPVLLKEVLKFLNPQPGENFIDCTVGLGGHSLEIIKKNAPDGRILGIDQDPESLEILKQQNNQRLILVQGNFANLKKIADENNFSLIDGILLDLGISSWQLEESGRGISFQQTEPLDMRMDSEHNDLTAEEIVNAWPQSNLEKIFFEYGGEKFSRRIAGQIAAARKIKKIKTTYELVGLIIKAYPQRKIRRIHPATKVFQALRIAVNNELENLEKTLPQTLDILKPGGRIAVISFHSLEDRIVKNFFRDNARNNLLKVLTKKPIIPSEAEVKFNSRSRSAKLRSAIKL